jgi:hypothetical protein
MAEAFLLVAADRESMNMLQFSAVFPQEGNGSS